MTGTAVAVGIDVGGTKLTACTLDDGATILDRLRSSSPTGNPSALLDEIARLASTLPEGPGLPLGVGVPGPVSRAGIIDLAPNLGIENVDVVAGLTERLGRQPVVTNDASAALVAEHAVGAAAGHDDVVMLTVGTGVGGAVLVSGELLLGAHGFAGELGHMIADPAGPTCGCGAVGCLEAVASGSAMTARARELVAVGDVATLLSDGPIDGHALDAAAAAGDEIALRVRREAAEHLGRAAGSLVNIFDPSLVLLGGGAGVNAADHLVPVMRQTMAERITGQSRPVPPIVVAQLGDDAGMIGAGLLALKHQPGEGTP